MADAAPEAVLRKHRHGRPWVSVRPHYRGLPLKLAGRGQASGAKSPCSGFGRQVPGSADQGFKTPRRNAERRCRVPLFPGNPGNKPRPVTKVRLSAFRLPLFCSRARSPEPPIHVKQFAGGDDAWPEGAM
jgi:hypothetical protein